MTKEERVKKILLNPEGFKLREEYPEEVKVAVKSFLEATKMVMTENLETIPHEYLTNMLEVLVKYQEKGHGELCLPELLLK